MKKINKLGLFILIGLFSVTLQAAKKNKTNKEKCIQHLRFGLDPEVLSANIDYIKASEDAPLHVLRNEIKNTGGFYSRNFDVTKDHDTIYTKTLYATSNTDQGAAGNCWMHAQLNSYRQFLKSTRRAGSNFEFSTAWVYYHDLLEKSNRRLAQAVLAIDKYKNDDFLYKRIRQKIDEVDDGGLKNYLPFLIDKYGLVPLSVMPDTAALKDSSQMLYDINEHVYRIINEMIYKEKELKNNPKLNKAKRIDALLEIRDRGIIGLQKILGTYLGFPHWEKFKAIVDNGSDFVPSWGLEKDGNLKHINSKVFATAEMTPHEFAEKYINIDSVGFVIVGSYPALPPGLYKVKRSSVGIPLSNQSKYDWTFLNLSNERLQQLVVEGIDLGLGVEFSTNMSRGIDIESGIMHPDIRMTQGLFGLEKDEAGREMTLKEESLLGFNQQEHAMAFVGYDKRDGEDAPVKKFLVKNSWGPWYGGPKEQDKNYAVQYGDFHMYREFFEKNVFEILVPRILLTEEEQKLLDGKAKLLKKDDAVRLKNRMK